MKYPQHLILDLTFTTSQTKPSLEWPGELRRYTPITPSPLKNLYYYNTVSPTRVFSPTTTSVLTKSLTLPLFDAHFLRKEKLYTKLKYSRCPQYDIVSGGFAAILAGFIGFLISEKFGIELVDSGDFYNAFMYGVFVVFSLRPLIRIYSKDTSIYNPLSLKPLLIFIHDVLLLVIRTLKHPLTLLYSRLK